MAQETGEKIKLCFIKNPQHNITAVEAFLKKRNYEVHVFTQTEKGMNFIEHNDPQYIFLAWDHIDETIRMLPQTIYQFATGQIIPFTFSTQRDQLFKLETSGFEHKLYPPISGPAILRIISKVEKKNQELNIPSLGGSGMKKPESSMIQVKSFFKDEGAQKNSFKKNLSESDIVQLADKNKKRLNTFLSDAHSNQGQNSILLSNKSKNLSSRQAKSLEENYFNEVKQQISALKEKSLNQDGFNESVKNASHLFTLIIQEPEWTGYLCLATESYIDIEEIKPILNNWVKKMVHESQDEKDRPPEALEVETPIFEIRISPIDFTDLCEKKSNFHKDIVVGNKTTTLGYFPFSPFHVLNNMQLELNYLELPTEYLKGEIEIPFDLYLYLPENKKMLLYARQFSTLEESKIEKITQHKIQSVYTPLEFDDILMQYKANINMTELIEQYYMETL